jgi:4-hydroxy-4-methyl-2-oxoglutarate aldolase
MEENVKESAPSSGGNVRHDRMFKVYEQVVRPEPHLVAEFSKLPVANLSDACGNLNTMDSGIQVMTPGMRICGTACTVSTRGGDFVATLLGLAVAQAGDVLVIDNQGRTDAAVWGEITTVEAQRKGLAGLVVDGNVRDIEGIRNRKFPVFARGRVPRVVGRSSLGEVNVAIQCGGVVVHPGDIVVGDADGIVVVAKEKAEAVLRLALNIGDYENHLLQKVMEGATQAEIFAIDKQFESLVDAHMKH